jgi:NADH-quinone oxidoreductase subunit L
MKLFSSPECLLWSLLALPLASALVSALFFRRSRWGAPVVSCVAAGGVLAVALVLLLGQGAGGSGVVRFSYEWLRLGELGVNMGFLLDANAAVLLFVVTFVGFWIHVFSVGYMDNDGARGRFFAGLSLFMFSILGIVLADNLYMIFVFWELVGFSSYMLIAHYFDRGDAVMASKKAFVVNRIGDFGFLLGIVLCRTVYGTVDLVALEAGVAGVGGRSTLVGLLLMCGFLGKSAQFPLHVWLTDAMAGPTPVSALIHAATMVAAGVYFMVRVFFLLTPFVLDVMLWSGALMALMAAFCALAQVDIKRSLAYSTLSHLGFMGVAIGLGLPGVALLHLTMHAFFKATLFLCAGSVIHACRHEQDMTRMGGLLRRMPVTHAAFVLAGASLCALPGTAGWISKDAILGGALIGRHYGVFVVLLLAALGSAFYFGRMWVLVFVGRVDGGGTLRGWLAAFVRGGGGGATGSGMHVRESRGWMTVPLGVLGVCAVASGMVGWVPLPELASAAFSGVYHVLHEQLVASRLSLVLLFGGAAVSVGGFVCAVWFYRRGEALREGFPRLYGMLEYRWFDTLYGAWIARVLQPLSNAIGFLDTLLVNGLVVRGIGGGIPGLIGLASRRLLHTGNVGHYVFWLVLGVLFYGAVLWWNA